MVTKLDLFYVKSLLEKIANGSDKQKAEAAKKILGNSLLTYEYTKIFIENRDKENNQKRVMYN